MFGRDGEGTFGEKTIGPKARKTFLLKANERNAQSQVRAGHERNRHYLAPAQGRP